MNDRDHFAAAALAGLLAATTDKDRSMDYWARLSYEVADAMLRERKRVAEEANSRQVGETCRRSGDVTEPLPAFVSGRGFVTPVSYEESDERRCFFNTNHDAAPAATARTDADRDRTDKAAARPGEGTGDTFWPIAKRETDRPQAVAWAITNDEREAVSLAGSRLSADPMYASVCAVLFGLLKRTK